MGAPFAEATETDIEISMIGLKIQAEAHGLDLSDKKIMAFIEHNALVVGTDKATIRKLQQIINELSLGEQT